MRIVADITELKREREEAISLLRQISRSIRAMNTEIEKPSSGNVEVTEMHILDFLIWEAHDQHRFGGVG